MRSVLPAPTRVVARREPELQAAAESLASEGIAAVSVAADLAAKDSAAIVAASAQIQRLSIDIIVNAAGVNGGNPSKQVSADAFDLHMALHLRAPFLLTRFAPDMAKRGWGRIVNVASMQSFGRLPIPRLTAPPRAACLS